MTGCIDPLTPEDCDLRDFAFIPMDIIRLFGSEFHARSSDAGWRAGVTLWLKSFHQVPAASIPNDDVQLARLAELGRDVKEWRRIKGEALHGWVECSDGRLYHPVVAEKANEAWRRKEIQRERSKRGNAARWGARSGDSDESGQGKAGAVGGAGVPFCAEQGVQAGEACAETESLKESHKDSLKDSHKESFKDRKGQGQGQGERKEEPSSSLHGGVSALARGDDDCVDTQEGWADAFASLFGVAVDVRSRHDRERFWPLATRWIAAGVTVGQMRAAVERAGLLATEPIAYLPGYVDRVLAGMQVPAKVQANPADVARLTVPGSTEPDPALLKIAEDARKAVPMPEDVRRRLAEIKRMAS